MHPAAASCRATVRRDSGLTLAEVLVGIALAVVAGAIGLTLLMGVNRTSVTVRDEADVENQQLNATDALYLDVSDTIRVVEADAAKMVVDIARPATDLAMEGADTKGMVCVRRTWQVEDPQTVAAGYDSTVTWTGANLVMLTQQFATSSCQGDLGEPVRHEVIGDHLLTELEPFAYFKQWDPDRPMRTPVATAKSTDSNDIFHVASMSVTVTSRSARMHNDRPMISGAAFGKMTTPGTGVQAQQMKAPILRVVTTSGTATPKRDEGVDDPVLEWTDSTANVAAGWAVYALRYPTDAPEGTRGQYRQVGYVINADPTATSQTLTWTDRDIEPGDTAQYVVVPVNAAQQPGPDSNLVMTGVRPAAPVLTVTGTATDLQFSWPAVAGATGYSIYRDGQVWRNVTGNDSTHGADSTGVGAAHTYQVVAVNRWESKWWCGSDTCEAAAGTYDAAAKGHTGATRELSNVQGAWSAPVAPTAVSGTNRLPANTDSADSTWDPTVDLTWAPPAWTAAAWATHPTNDAGVSDATFAATKALLSAAKAAVRYDVVRDGATLRSGLVTASTTDPTNLTSARGVTLGWLVTSSTVAGGKSPAFAGASATGSALMWPAAPTCVASLGAAGQPGSRAATVAVGSTTGATGYRAQLTAVGPRPGSGTLGAPDGPGSILAGPVAGWTSLTHSTAHSWRGQASNAAGRGPWGAGCGVTTDAMTVGLTGLSATTRTISASSAASGGTAWSLLLDGGSEQGGTAATWDPLPHASAHTVTARNSDGFNLLDVSAPAATATLTAPVAVCSRSLDDGVQPGAITVSGGDLLRLEPGNLQSGGPSHQFTGLGDGYWTAYALNRASDGYNTVESAWSACGPSVYIQGPPATPPSSGITVQQQRYCAPSEGFEMNASWGAVSGATKYEYLFTWSTDNAGNSYGGETTGRTVGHGVNDPTAHYGSAKFRVRAYNSAGWSAWSSDLVAVNVSGCQTT